MTKYGLISLILYSLVGTTNIIIAFVFGASIYSVVAAWLCYLAFATLTITQQIAINKIKARQQLERKIFLDFFEHSIKNANEQNSNDLEG